MRCVKDASIVPDFGKEEIPIIAMTYVTAGSEKLWHEGKGRRGEDWIFSLGP